MKYMELWILLEPGLHFHMLALGWSWIVAASLRQGKLCSPPGPTWPLVYFYLICLAHVGIWGSAPWFKPAEYWSILE